LPAVSRELCEYGFLLDRPFLLLYDSGNRTEGKILLC
jgi:hypothetical protein